FLSSLKIRYAEYLDPEIKTFESDDYKVLKGRKLQEFKGFLHGSCVAQLPSEIKNSSLLFTEETNYEKDTLPSTKRNVKGGLKTVNELVLVESRTAREQFIDKVEVLEKVKALPTLPDDLHVTIDMAAEYYEVEKKTAEKVIERHKNEFLSDGYKVLKGKEFKDFVTDVASVANFQVNPKARSLALLPRR